MNFSSAIMPANQKGFQTCDEFAKVLRDALDSFSYNKEYRNSGYIVTEANISEELRELLRANPGKVIGNDSLLRKRLRIILGEARIKLLEKYYGPRGSGWLR